MTVGPQKENGFTPIANEIMEALCRIRIPGEAHQILSVVIRKTYGYNKKEDAISLSQFCLATGLNKPHVCQSLLKLKAMNLITEKGNDIATIYCFNKHYDTWKPLPKKVKALPKTVIITENSNASLPKTVMTVTENSNLPLPNSVHTKESLTKDNITKDTTTKYKQIKPVKKPPADVKLFIDFAFQTFHEKFNEKMHIDGGKDGSNVKALLGTYDLEKLKSLWMAFISSSDDFIQKAGYSIGVFKSQVNKLLVGNSGATKQYSAAAAPAMAMIEEIRRKKAAQGGQ